MKVEDIKRVVLVGGGAMGQGIAQSFAQAGLSVSVVDIDQKQLDRCLARVEANLRLFEEYDLLKEELSTIKSRISSALLKDLDSELESCDIVVETIPENLDLKRGLFAQLDSCRDEVILATNTSSFTVSAVAEGCRTPERVIGLHFFNPAQIMPLVEIHFSPQTDERVIATTKALMLRVGKKPVIVKKAIPGFIINRLQSAIARETEYLIAESVASPEDINTALKASLGLRYACIGNLEAADMVGLDTVLAVGRQLYKEINNSTEPSPLLVEKVRRGELGVKSGRGWFDYAGKSRGDILDSYNRKLIQQLALFNSFEETDRGG